MNNTILKGIQKTQILKIATTKVTQIEDSLAVESPLEIRLTVAGAHPPIRNKSISITMCTPGDTVDLVYGFLFTEGIISNANQVIGTEETENGITVYLNMKKPIDLDVLYRNSFTNSSCGVCGKSNLKFLDIKRTVPQKKVNWQIDSEDIKRFPALVRAQQSTFESTGGLHAAGLFNLPGNLIGLREDVGRHNAVDKLIGAYFQLDQLPLQEHILFLSGRASFELIQKAAMAGISMVVAVGAPSSLAVETAVACDITLVGFLKEKGFNVYYGEKRLRMS
ncbi:formate dehydrogenase accessory sulfurtransferase FdhD [Arenibacter sp. GZD96]|uniref:formate dehydrogenase accessory sulfurtransferase FdhD n=1 Tax=Aurantibrevibacter litoralis TaxID=3106030 RepID=UPI002B003587|nr:formate dehydrogenase accessory sulfurtransferase FdhD [Arenibacter sp. GZD-96]MEA1786340.1 formate dehydrogenase accessory sulfurtransferase FdhD [Arenibacter sp. GZD-96]